MQSKISPDKFETSSNIKTAFELKFSEGKNLL